MPIIEPFTFPEGLEAGQRASLSCTVAIGDYPMQIAWFKDGKPLITESNLKVLQVSHYSISLIFEWLTSANRGNYTCKASNQAGHASYSAYLNIDGKSIAC